MLFARRRSSLTYDKFSCFLNIACCLLVIVGHVQSMSLDRRHGSARQSRQFQQQNDKQLEFSESMVPEAESELLVQNDMELVPAVDGLSDMYLLVPAAAAAPGSNADNQQSIEEENLQTLENTEQQVQKVSLTPANAESNSDMLMLESEDTPAVQILELPEDVVPQESEPQTVDNQAEEEQNLSETMMDTLAEAVQEIKHELETELVEQPLEKEKPEEVPQVNEEEVQPMEHKDNAIEMPADNADNSEQEMIGVVKEEPEQTAEQLNEVMDDMQADASEVQPVVLEMSNEIQEQMPAEENKIEEGEAAIMSQEMSQEKIETVSDEAFETMENAKPNEETEAEAEAQQHQDDDDVAEEIKDEGETSVSLEKEALVPETLPAEKEEIQMDATDESHADTVAETQAENLSNESLADDETPEAINVAETASNVNQISEEKPQETKVEETVVEAMNEEESPSVDEIQMPAEAEVLDKEQSAEVTHQSDDEQQQLDSNENSADKVEIAAAEEKPEEEMKTNDELQISESQSVNVEDEELKSNEEHMQAEMIEEVAKQPAEEVAQDINEQNDDTEPSEEENKESAVVEENQIAEETQNLEQTQPIADNQADQTANETVELEAEAQAEEEIQTLEETEPVKAIETAEVAEIVQEPDTLPEIVEEYQPMEEVQDVQHDVVEAAQPMEEVQALQDDVEEVQAMNEDAQPMAEIQPAVEETQAVEQQQSMDEVQANVEAQAMEEVQANVEDKPMEEAQAMEEAQSMEEAQAMEEAQPMEEAQAMEEVQSLQDDIEEVQPVAMIEDAQPMEETQAMEQAQPVEELQSVENIEPLVENQEIQSVEEMHTLEQNQSMDEMKSEVEDIQPVEDMKPLEEQPMEVEAQSENENKSEEIKAEEELQTPEATQADDDAQDASVAEAMFEDIKPVEIVAETQSLTEEAEPMEHHETVISEEEEKPAEIIAEHNADVSDAEISADELVDDESTLSSAENENDNQNQAVQPISLADEDILQNVDDEQKDKQNDNETPVAAAEIQKPLEDKDSDNILNDDTNESETTSMLTTIVQVPTKDEQIQTQQQEEQQQQQEENEHETVVETTFKPLNVLDSVLNYVNASFMNQMNNENNDDAMTATIKPEIETAEEQQEAFSSKLRRYDGAQVWRIVVQNDKERKLADELQTKFDGQLWKEVKQEVDYLLKPNVLADAEQHVKAANLSRIVLIDNLQKVIEVENPTPEQIANLQFDNRKAHRLTWQAYHRLDDIHNFYDTMAKTYPDICAVETIGYSIEKRPLKILKISNGNADNPSVWIDGGMHAREWISPAVVTFVANQIVEGWDDLPSYMRNINWYIHAVANPDGYEYSHTTDRLWRKNMRSHGRACPGVDLNRNFGYKWGGKGTSANPCAQTYRGSKAFSEPETFYISKFISSYPRDTFKAYLSFHSYGQYILYPWGYDYHITKDMADLDLVARQAGTIITRSTGAKYTVGSSANTLYPAAGGSDDWAKGIAGIKYAYTIEMGDTGRFGFILPAEYIETNGKNGYTFVETIGKAITMGKNARRRKLKAHNKTLH